MRDVIPSLRFYSPLTLKNGLGNVFPFHFSKILSKKDLIQKRDKRLKPLFFLKQNNAHADLF